MFIFSPIFRRFRFIRTGEYDLSRLSLGPYYICEYGLTILASVYLYRELQFRLYGEIQVYLIGDIRVFWPVSGDCGGLGSLYLIVTFIQNGGVWSNFPKLLVFLMCIGVVEIFMTGDLGGELLVKLQESLDNYYFGRLVVKKYLRRFTGMLLISFRPRRNKLRYILKMNKLAPQHLYQIISYLPGQYIYLFEALSATILQRLKNNPYFLREIHKKTSLDWTYNQMKWFARQMSQGIVFRKKSFIPSDTCLEAFMSPEPITCGSYEKVRMLVMLDCCNSIH